MDLYSPKALNAFVIATVPIGSKDGVDPTYEVVQAPGLDEALQALHRRKLKNAYPYQVGRYDEQGYFCTYCPPVDGIKPGRYVRHPLAEQAKRDHDKRVQGRDYGSGTSNF